jgi:hypothetical protein
MLMNVRSIKKARSFYALSCTTSPGGKHRGLAGSVAVLIAESLLMLRSRYNRSVEKSMSRFTLISSGGVTEFRCTERDTCLLTTRYKKVDDGIEGLIRYRKITKNAVHPLSTFAILSAPSNQ